MSGFTLRRDVFPAEHLLELRQQIRKSKFFTVNNLNRDFVGTRGFSIVFRRTAMDRVREHFPWSCRYLDAALRDDCNAFYLNPLQLTQGSNVSSHIDRSLRAYVLDIDPPLAVSVLYVDVPEGMQGGDLVLRRGKKFLGRVTPEPGLLVEFDGDLDHGVERVDTAGQRLSLVCEQYLLEEDQLGEIPEFSIESRARSY
jgi:hypothetical protein